MGLGEFSEEGVYEGDEVELIETVRNIPISLHCWQGDDVRGFDGDPNAPLTGGIQTTGNYPGKATTPEQLMADIDKAFALQQQLNRERRGEPAEAEKPLEGAVEDTAPEEVPLPPQLLPLRPLLRRAQRRPLPRRLNQPA